MFGCCLPLEEVRRERMAPQSLDDSATGWSFHDLDKGKQVSDERNSHLEGH
jgi:hypothetical protein